MIRKKKKTVNAPQSPYSRPTHLLVVTVQFCIQLFSSRDRYLGTSATPPSPATSSPTPPTATTAQHPEN